MTIPGGSAYVGTCSVTFGNRDGGGKTALLRRLRQRWRQMTSQSSNNRRTTTGRRGRQTSEAASRSAPVIGETGSVSRKSPPQRTPAIISCACVTSSRRPQKLKSRNLGDRSSSTAGKTRRTTRVRPRLPMTIATTRTMGIGSILHCRIGSRIRSSRISNEMTAAANARDAIRRSMPSTLPIPSCKRPKAKASANAGSASESSFHLVLRGDGATINGDGISRVSAVGTAARTRSCARARCASSRSMRTSSGLIGSPASPKGMACRESLAAECIWRQVRLLAHRLSVSAAPGRSLSERS